MQYCDSLRIAYTFKSKELDNLTQRNKLLFRQLSAENEKISQLQNQIERQQNEILKIKSKPNHNWLYGVGGVALGVVVGLLL